MNERWQGIVLFLPVPIVLWLITNLPFGVWPSLGLGVTIMVTHRLYARPFALNRARRRCLWCGGTGENLDLAPLTVEEPMGETVWQVCAGKHRISLAAFLGWSSRRALFLKVGIVGALLTYLVTVPLAAYGKLGSVTAVDLSYGFRLLIALTVLPLGWLGPGSRSGGGLTVPFPIHIQALIGTVAVAWLFRIIGLIWLVASVIHFTGG
jgi:hypothetical protein